MCVHWVIVLDEMVQLQAPLLLLLPCVFGVACHLERVREKASLYHTSSLLCLQLITLFWLYIMCWWVGSNWN